MTWYVTYQTICFLGQGTIFRSKFIPSCLNRLEYIKIGLNRPDLVYHTLMYPKIYVFGVWDYISDVKPNLRPSCLNWLEYTKIGLLRPIQAVNSQVKGY